MVRGGIDAGVALAKVERAILGSGPLTAHAGLYLLTTLGLFIRAVIRDPAGLPFPNPWIVVSWGLLVVVHSAVVAAATVMRQPWVGGDDRGKPGDQARRAGRHDRAIPATRGTAGSSRPGGRPGGRTDRSPGAPGDGQVTARADAPAAVTAPRDSGGRDETRGQRGQDQDRYQRPAPAAPSEPTPPPPTARFRPQSAASLADVVGRTDPVMGRRWRRPMAIPRWAKAAVGRLRRTAPAVWPAPGVAPSPAMRRKNGQPISPAPDGTTRPPLGDRWEGTPTPASAPVGWAGQPGRDAVPRSAVTPPDTRPDAGGAPDDRGGPRPTPPVAGQKAMDGRSGRSGPSGPPSRLESRPAGDPHPWQIAATPPAAVPTPGYAPASRPSPPGTSVGLSHPVADPGAPSPARPATAPSPGDGPGGVPDPGDART